MTDLTERLRSYGPHHHDVRLHFEAADAIEQLTETGPPMSRGTNADGTPKMGTMRDVLLDYKQAAESGAHSRTSPTGQ